MNNDILNVYIKENFQFLHQFTSNIYLLFCRKGASATASSKVEKNLKNHDNLFLHVLEDYNNL